MKKAAAVSAGIACLTLFDIAAADAAGFYLGPHVDLVMAPTTISSDSIYGPLSFDLPLQGLMGGVQGGFSIGGAGLAGPFFAIEASAGFGQLFAEDSYDNIFEGDGVTVSATSMLNWTADLSVKGGFTVGPFGIYGLAGVTFGGFHGEYVETLYVVDTEIDRFEASFGPRRGLTIGGGLQVSLGAISIMGEYRLTKYGADQTVTDTWTFGTETATYSVGRVRTLRGGISYSF